MDSSGLTGAEKQLVGRLLYEAANGAYFPDWEFETLVGADKSTVRKAASRWLTGEEISSESKALAISVLNNLLGYPHSRAAELEAALGVQMASLANVFATLERKE